LLGAWMSPAIVDGSSAGPVCQPTSVDPESRLVDKVNDPAA
jgi:hypothetical protein